MNEPTHYCGDCDGAYAIRAGFGCQPAVHCPGCGKRGLMVVTATLGADEYTARVEAAIEKHMPPDDECEPIIAPKQP